MQAEQISLQKQNEEIRDAYREKFKAQQQVQKMYQSLKAQVMASQVAVAAGDEVEMTSQTARGDRFIDRIPGTRTGTANLNKVGIGLQGGIGLPPTFTSHMQGRVYPDRMYPSLSIPSSRRIRSIHALIN
jgi:hypothetical protein